MSLDDLTIPIIPRDPRSRWRPAGRSTIPVAVADGVVNLVRKSGGDLKLSGGDLHVQEAGVWRIATRADKQWLRCLVQEGVEVHGEGARLSIVTASWRRLLEHPGLYVRTRNRAELVAIATPPRICPVAQWAHSMLIPVELGRVSRRDLLCAFRGWWREQTDDNVRLISAAWLLHRLRTACPHVTNEKIDGLLYVGGIHLTDEGLGYWEQQAADASRYGGLPTISASAMAVNREASFSQREVRARASIASCVPMPSMPGAGKGV